MLNKHASPGFAQIWQNWGQIQSISGGGGSTVGPMLVECGQFRANFGRTWVKFDRRPSNVGPILPFPRQVWSIPVQLWPSPGHFWPIPDHRTIVPNRHVWARLARLPQNSSVSVPISTNSYPYSAKFGRCRTEVPKLGQLKAGASRENLLGPRFGTPTAQHGAVGRQVRVSCRKGSGVQDNGQRIGAHQAKCDRSHPSLTKPKHIGPISAGLTKIGSKQGHM